MDQYSGYKIEAIDLYVNGKMTQGENIADNGGLKQVYFVRLQILIKEEIYWMKENGFYYIVH